MANLPGSFAQSQASYGLLSDLNYLSVNYGTYKTFVEKYPALAKSNYIIGAEASGAGVWTPTRVFYHWEPKGKTLPMFNITANSTAAAGLPITVTLTAGSHTNAGAKSPIAIGYVFENSTTRQVYRVTAVNQTVAGAHTATLQIDTAAAVPLVTAATDSLLYRGRAVVEEASTYVNGLYRENVRLSNECRTVRDDMEFTDRLLMEKIENPAGGHYYKNDQLNNVFTPRFAAVQEMDLMFGHSADGLGTANNSSAKGLIQDIETNGTTLTHSATLAATFWQSAKRLIEAEGYSNEYDVLQDPEFFMKVQDYLGTTFNNGAVIYCAPEKSSKPIEIAQNFKSFDIYGIKYNFQQYDYFNNAKMFGAPVSTAATLTGYSNYGIMIPQGDAPDANTGAPVKRFGVRYQAEKEGDAAIQMWTTGAFSPENKTPVRELRVHAACDKGIETFGIQGFLSVNLT